MIPKMKEEDTCRSSNIQVKLFKNGPNKICVRQPLTLQRRLMFVKGMLPALYLKLASTKRFVKGMLPALYLKLASTKRFVKGMLTALYLKLASTKRFEVLPH